MKGVGAREGPSTYVRSAVVACLLAFVGTCALASQVTEVVSIPAAGDEKQAPQNPGADATLQASVQGLASPLFDVRLDAEDALRKNPQATLERFEELLLQPALDAEQRIVLAALARERFESEPRAALGINYNSAWVGERRNSPAIISGTVLGFDSARVLMPGDAILSFDGILVTDQATFRSHILSYNPGEFARLKIERDDKILEVDVQMGSQDQLRKVENVQPNNNGGFGAINPITSSTLDEAWAIRAHRRHIDVGDGDTLLDGEITGAAWRTTWGNEALDPRHAQPEVAIVAGGKARGAPPEAMREFVGGEFRAQNRAGRNWQNRDPNAFRIQQLESINRQIDVQVSALRRQAESLGPDAAAEKQRVTRDIERLSAIKDQNQRAISEMTGGRPNFPRR